MVPPASAMRALFVDVYFSVFDQSRFRSNTHQGADGVEDIQKQKYRNDKNHFKRKQTPQVQLEERGVY